MNPAFKETLPIFTFISATMSNSIDTRAIDSYRQGVELTLDPYFYDGVVKIWCGEPNHQLPQRAFGEAQEEIFPDRTFFTELDYFDPLNFIRQQAVTGNMPTLSYPVVFQASILRPGNVLDGVVEPLTIRHVAQFASIDAPFEPHAFHGNLESGNFNHFTNADRVVQRVQFNQSHRGTMYFEDNADTLNGMPTNVGFFPNNTMTLSPFNDQLKSGIILDSQMSAKMAHVIYQMSCSTDNYCPPGYKVLPSGFTWMNTKGGIGAESLAFGDLAYKSTV